MTNIIDNSEKIILNKISNIKYFKFDTYDDIKKIEKRHKINFKLYDEQMVLDIFANGIDLETETETKTKYLDSKLNQKETGKILNLFGLYLMSMGKIEEAIEYFKNALDLGFVQSSNNIGKCYKIIRKFKLAEEYYLKSIDLNEFDSYAWLGKLYIKNEEYSKAIDIWLKGIDNNSALCCLFLGEYYEENENYKLAKIYYLTGLDLNIDSIINCNEIYGKLGYLLWSKLNDVDVDDDNYNYNYNDIDIDIDNDIDNKEKGIKYLKKGMELNDSMSYYYYAVIKKEILGDWENEIIECYKKSIQINMDLDAIYELAEIYKKRGEYENMTTILKLGVELNSYDCIGMLANYYEKSDSDLEPDNIEKALELYELTYDSFGCEYSLVKIANIYGSSKYNQIDKFVSNNTYAAKLFNWLGCFELGIYYLKNNSLEESKKYLIKALDLYWMRIDENQNIIFPNQFVHMNDSESYDIDIDIDIDYYVKKYKKIFGLIDIWEAIKLSNNQSLNIINYIEKITTFFIPYTDGYYPVLIIILLNKIINDPIIVLEILKKINNTFIFQYNFMFAMIKILENKINHKTILNRIKRAKKNKKFKECIVCYENKVHIKFNCGHEICCCCYKKMCKCYYNCHLSKLH